MEVTNPIWVFGDGDTLTMIENPGHVFEQPGEYTVELTAFAVGTGCPNTWTETIIIRPIPVANATATPLFGCPPLSVSFSNASLNGDFYLWDYGDGNTDVGPNPEPHVYTEPGFYDVRLLVRDAFGCAHDSVVATIQVYPVPVIEFTTDQDLQCGVPVELCFGNNSTNGGEYNWDFGNGERSAENNPCVTYDTPGDYLITLDARNEFLCATTTEVPITVYGEPMADFSISDTTGCVGDPVSFTSNSEHAEYTEWLFSDGYRTNEPAFSRTFTETGTLDITLIVGNGSGCADTLMRMRTLTIYNRPLAGLVAEELPDSLPVTYAFEDRSSEDAIIFGWDFGDGTISEEMDAIHRYISGTDKWVLHWVENTDGCTDTTEIFIDLPAQ
ncbi:MAG: PKD domain-containing protein, partial [Bacteroidota bacterium]